MYACTSKALLQKRRMVFRDDPFFLFFPVSYTGGICNSHRNCVLAEFSKGMENVDTIAHEVTFRCFGDPLLN
jgi:hypothetical protein